MENKGAMCFDERGARLVAAQGYEIVANPLKY
jgi:hypothetical protein